MCFSSRPCGSAVALRTGPGSDQTPLWADLARMVGQKSVAGRSRVVGFANDCRQMTIDLLTVQLHYQLLVHGQLDVFASRQRNHAPLVVLAIDLQPHRRRLMTGKIPCDFENRNLAAAFPNLNFFSYGDLIRRNVYLLTVHLYVPVTYQLARLAAGNAEPEPVDNVVQAPLERLEQLRTRHTFGFDRVLEVIPELAFLGEVDAFGFLFFAQLQTVAYNFGLLVFPVLSGSEVAFFNRTLVAEALGAFQEELDAFPATKTTHCIGITSQVVLLS